MVTAKLRCYRQSYVWSVLELESCRAMPDHCRDSYLHNLPATSLTGNPLINSRHYTGLALDALFVLLSTLLSCASFVVERPPLKIGCNKFVIPGRWMELCYYSVFFLIVWWRAEELILHLGHTTSHQTHTELKSKLTDSRP